MLIRSAALALGLAAAIAPAKADPVSDFYRGKNIQLIVGYGPGGGYDVYARLVARFFGKHVPGAPDVVVQNMPGAGSLRAANYIYVTAPRDGTVIGTFARNMPLLGVLDDNPNVQFDPRKFTWLGSPSSARERRLFAFRQQGRGGEDRGGSPEEGRPAAGARRHGGRRHGQRRHHPAEGCAGSELEDDRGLSGFRRDRSSPPTARRSTGGSSAFRRSRPRSPIG